MYPLFFEVALLVIVVQERTIFVCMRVFDSRAGEAIFVFACGMAFIMIMARLVTVCTNRNPKIGRMNKGSVVRLGILPRVRPVLCLGRLVRQRGTGRL